MAFLEGVFPGAARGNPSRPSAPPPPPRPLATARDIPRIDPESLPTPAVLVEGPPATTALAPMPSTSLAAAAAARAPALQGLTLAHFRAQLEDLRDTSLS